MADKAYVYSTLATDTRYVEWLKVKGSDMPVQGRSVLIKGGTGVANSNFITPLGVVTEIDAEDIAILEANEVYKVHAANGHITISKKSSDPEKVAASMSLDDPSSPRTPSHPDMQNEPATA